MKRAFALATVTALSLGVMGCSGSSDSTAAKGEKLDCELETASWAKDVKVEASKGEAATVTASLKDGAAESLQLVEAKKGDGKEVVASADVVYNMMVTLVGPDGAQIAAQPLETAFDANSGLVDWIISAASCVTDNGRATIAGPASELMPSATEGDSAQFNATTPLIAVIDMQGVSEKLAESEILKHAEGEEKALPEGFPEVTFDEETGPQIIIPEDVKQPTELKVATQIVGTGEEVKDGANVYVHYRGVIWRTGEEFDASWTKGQYTNFKTDQVIKGFTAALVGQKVGSRVVALVDPDSGYGASQLESMGHQADDVMVFVVDILGVENPAS